jgi:hypothetical protein
MTHIRHILPCYNHGSMAGIRSSRQTGSDQPVSFQNFKSFVQRLVAVPHSEIKAALDAEKEAKKQKRASRASSDKG